MVGIDECSGVQQVLRGCLGVLKQNIEVKNIHNGYGGSEFSKASQGLSKVIMVVPKQIT